MVRTETRIRDQVKHLGLSKFYCRNCPENSYSKGLIGATVYRKKFPYLSMSMSVTVIVAGAVSTNVCLPLFLLFSLFLSRELLLSRATERIKKNIEIECRHEIKIL